MTVMMTMMRSLGFGLLALAACAQPLEHLPVRDGVGYPVEVLPRSNRTVLAMEYMANGMLQVVALGKDGQLWHVYQKSEDDWTDWEPLTTICPSALVENRACFFDGDPVVARNADGRLEVFARFMENLDVWQMYQLDASKPEKWSMPREGSCVDQDQTTAKWSCLKQGRPDVQSSEHYWIVDSPVFSTSDLTALRNPRSGKIQLFFRNFEGHMYMVEQIKAGDSSKYTSPDLVTSQVLFI